MEKIIGIIITLLFAVAVHAQDYILEIPVAMAGDLSRLSKAVSIDKIRDGVVTAYASESELMALRTILPQYAYRKYDRKSLSKSGDIFEMASDAAAMQDWARYPTYELYVEMMRNFAAQHPDIASLVEIGSSVEGRQILALRISGEGDTLKRPRVFITSSMHGDEVCGFVLSLRMIDFLLSSYGTHPTVTQIVDNIVLYINPLANPDGTYFGGNNKLEEARRYNYNNIDLNRNFPVLGAAVQTLALEPETRAMIDFAKSRHFALSANLHSGDEVLNYPWDSFYEHELRLADKDWFVDVCQKYIDTLRTFAPEGMKTVKKQGYVLGSEWYKMVGGRQDWMLFAEHCRELTIELSSVKIMYGDRLDSYWQRNRDALLLYISSALQGINGNVSDVSGKPVKAHIYLDRHDDDYSAVVCDDNGFFTRPTLAAKTYDVCAVADGYVTECQTVNTNSNQLVTIDFTMKEGISEYTVASEISTPKTPVVSVAEGNIRIESSHSIDRVIISDILGRTIASHTPKANSFVCSADNLIEGTYVIYIQTGGVRTSSKISITK